MFQGIIIALFVLGVMGPAATALAQEKPEVDVGGAMRWNYFVKDWVETDDANPQWALDTFRINVDGSYMGVYLSAEYRFYAGYHMIHHGYFGYDFNDHNSIHFGVHQVPFGIQPYASHNWFFQLPYYVGLEDDYDAGLKWLYDRNAFHFALAYYVNDEGNYTGNSPRSARYSYDIVGNHYERNQINARLAYDIGDHEIGVSGQYGQLYNKAINKTGDHVAYAVHGNLNFGALNVKAEVISYAINAEVVAGGDDTIIPFGAYDFPYTAASEATFYVAGVSYSVPVEIGPISNLTFYENYTLMTKAESDFDDSMNAITGVMVTAGNIYTYVDLAMGQNHPWIGGDWTTSLAQGSYDDMGELEQKWHTRFNINIGYYF